MSLISRKISLRVESKNPNKTKQNKTHVANTECKVELGNSTKRVEYFNSARPVMCRTASQKTNERREGLSLESRAGLDGICRVLHSPTAEHTVLSSARCPRQAICQAIKQSQIYLKQVKSYKVCALATAVCHQKSVTEGNLGNFTNTWKLNNTRLTNVPKKKSQGKLRNTRR